MQQLIKNHKGVSLPLITGLVTLLLIASVAINALIIRNMRSIQRIEASNKAYMAAEAGIEDALYELTPHFAGYETNTKEYRTTKFDKKGWENKWNIESINKSGTYSGKIYNKQKLIIPLFKDTNRLSTANAPNKINAGTANIQTLAPTTLDITFTIPESIIKLAPYLQIDNDKDGSLNEDPVNEKDYDGDGQIDEDSNESAVILWKLTDGSRTLMPITGKKGAGGCLSDSGSVICEKDFKTSGRSVTLTIDDEGKTAKVEKMAIREFINTINSQSKLYFEFLIVSPLEHVDTSAGDKTIIPYIEYTVNSDQTQLPYPTFTIKSDGYYRKFKQSITSTVTPKMTVPLFDFTIIQQD